MLNWEQLFKELMKASAKHSQLASIFGEFAKAVESEVNEPTYHIKGIITSLQLDQNYFAVTFAGRTIVFLFTSLLEGGEPLKGIVQCYLKKDFPKPLYDKIGEFNFTGVGRTNLKMPDGGDADIVYINLHQLYLVHHFIYESLSL